MTESHALRAAKALKTPLAFWTVLLACMILTLYSAVVVAAVSGEMPLWLALAINAYLVYFAYTPIHEAVHGNIADDAGRWAFLNPLVGFLCTFPMIHNFSLHRTTHLAHHQHTYDPNHDADHWVKGANAWTTALRCLTLVVSHYRMGWLLNKGSAKGRRILWWALAQNIVTLAPMLFLIFIGYWHVAIMAIIIPAIIGSAILAFFFDYAVHYPKLGEDRFRRGRIYRAPRWIEPVVTAFYLGQNFHQIHHLYPWVPFYRYARLFRQVEPLLREKKTPIIMLGRSLTNIETQPVEAI